MKIGIDIDNTLFDTDTLIIKEGIEYDNNYLEGKGIKNKNAYLLEDKFYWSTEDKNKFIESLFINHKIFDLDPLSEASNITNKLHNDGYEIVIITYRHESDAVDTYSLTKKMLESNNIYFDKLIINATNKGIICERENIDIFIDDSLKHCNEAINHGVKNVILFNHEYNQNSGLFGLNNWLEIYDYVRGLKDE